MSSGSSIEWTSATWNPVVGCTRASRGCDRCYAVTMTHRLEAMGRPKYAGLTVLNAKGDRHFNGVVRTVPEALTIPLHWRKPRVIFVNSMSDLFHKDVPFEFIDKVFAVMALCPQHTFQILTKRPERMSEYLRECDTEVCWASGTPPKIIGDRISDHIAQHVGIAPFRLRERWPLPNVWLGTSIEHRDALHRADELRKCPAAVRFLSLEPLLEDLGTINLTGIHWVIIGGESGGGARPCNIDWIRSLIAQCKQAGVSCFVKQLGARIALRNDRLSEWPREGDVLHCLEPDDIQVMQGDIWDYRLNDRKGGDPAEWPADLRVREFPIGHQEAQNAQKETESV